MFKIRDFVFISLFLFIFSGPVFADKPKILKLQDLKPGTKAIGFSVFKGIEPEPFDVELGEATQLLNLNLILARLSGGPMETPLEKIGPVAGMSGSPIFVDCEDYEDCIKNGVLVGALSYGMANNIQNGINFMITPAEYMLGAKSGGYAVASQLRNFSPKISYQGREYKNLMLFPKMDNLDGGVGQASKCQNSSDHKLKPGSMVTVYLVMGQVMLGGSGTVTWVDGDAVYAFGHPIFGVGLVQLPFSHVGVAATLQTTDNPHKISGCSLDTKGLIMVDGTYEVAGRIGLSAPLLPFQVSLHVAGHKVSLNEEIPHSPMAREIINILPLIWARSIVGDFSDLSVVYQVRISIKNQPEIFFKSIVPIQGQSGLSPFGRVLRHLDEIIFQVLNSRGLMNQMEKVQVQVGFVNNLNVWKGKTSFLSQKSAFPGETVYVNVVLEEVSSGSIKQISIPVKIPDDFVSRLGPEDTSIVNVFVQSGSRFSDKKDDDFKIPSSPENFLRELNADLNRQMNVLYVQQIIPEAKGDKERDRNSIKSGTGSPWKWNDIEKGDLSRLPSKNNLEVILNTTSALEHYIDFDESFSINIKHKEDATESKIKSVPSKKKSKKWYFFFLH